MRTIDCTNGPANEWDQLFGTAVALAEDGNWEQALQLPLDATQFMLSDDRRWLDRPPTTWRSRSASTPTLSSACGCDHPHRGVLPVIDLPRLPTGQAKARAGQELAQIGRRIRERRPGECIAMRRRKGPRVWASTTMGHTLTLCHNQLPRHHLRRHGRRSSGDRRTIGWFDLVDASRRGTQM